MIELKDMKKEYGDRTVLDIDDLTVGDGAILAVAGANGSGKSTLLKILARQLKPTSGEFKVPEKTLYMPQRSYAFRGDLIENVTLGKAGGEKAAELLEKLGLSRLKDKKAKSLSGGELQRLSLCRVLAREAELLLLDEPTSACDAEGARLVTEAIRGYREKTGCTVIMSTHAPALAVNSADRLLILNNGRIEADGVPAEVLSEPKTDWARSFIEGWRI